MSASITDAVAEGFIFKAKHPKQHPDNWPIIDLKDVEISAPDTNEPVNLLTADAFNPLVLRGTVDELDDEQRKRCLRDKTDKLASGKRIEVAEVRQFSYGAYDDGGIELWAAGHAGWYTISPSPSNQHLYEQAVEAVRLNYFIVDSTVGVPLKKQKFDQIMIKFARQNKLAGGPDQARQLVRQHKRFLLTCMLSRKADLDPDNNIVFSYLAKSCAKEIKEIQARLARPYIPASSSSLKRKRGLSTTPVTMPKIEPSPSPSNTLSIIETATIGDAMTEDTMVDERGTRTRRKSARWLASQPEVKDKSISGPDPNAQSQMPGKGKSSLRPKPTKYVGKLYAEMSNERSPTTMARETASERPSRASASLQQSEDDEDSRPSKRAKREPYEDRVFTHTDVTTNMALDEGIDMSLDDMEDDPGNQHTDIPTIFALQTSKIEATSDGDLWRCPLDGCLHAVYAASQAESQKLIKDHYRLHVTDEDLEDKMQLVNRMRGPGVQLNRLVSRIQAQARQKSEGFPRRIVQRV